MGEGHPCNQGGAPSVTYNFERFIFLVERMNHSAMNEWLSCFSAIKINRNKKVIKFIFFTKDYTINESNRKTSFSMLIGS